MKEIAKDIRSIILTVIVTILYPVLINEKPNMFETINLLLIITLSICVCNIIVSYYSDKRYLSNLYQYLSVSFFGMGIVVFAYIYIIKDAFVSIDFWIRATAFNTTFSIYESIILLYSFKEKKNNYINIKLYLGIIAIGAMLTTIIGSYYIDFLRLTCSEQHIEDIRIISRTVAFLLKLYLFKVIVSNKEIKASKPKKYFIVFCASRIVIHLFGFTPKDSVSFYIIIMCFLLIVIGNYCIIKIMLVEIIRNPQEFLYKDLIRKTNELEKTIEELRESNNQRDIIMGNYERTKQEEKVKNEILTNISHEFKTPINVIYSAIQTLELKENNEEKINFKDYSFVIKQNCNRLIRLVNNFIDVTRFDNGDIKPNFENRNIVELTENIASSVIPFAESKNLHIIFDTSDEEIYSLVDVELYERLILNIFSNAIKYTNIEGNIEVNILKRNKDVKIAIRDYGIGISEENLKIIFNRFERADKTFSRDTEGSGLGLSISQKIVEILNGNIKIFSKEKKGTTVVITLLQSEYELDNSRSNELIDENIKREADIEMSDIYFT